MENNTSGRILAIAAGLVFTAGAAGILFEDVILKGAPLALKHGITLVTIAGTLMVGHLAHQTRGWSRAGFSLLFLVGTALVVFSSVGRQGEALAVTQAQADASEDARARAKDGIKRSLSMLNEAQASLARECRTGKGKRCDGIRATLSVYEAAAKGHQADLDRIGPAKPVAPEAEKLAEIAAVFGADKVKMKAGAVLLQPFLTALFLEFGAIVSFGFGFRSNQRVSSEKAKPNSATAKPNSVTEVANDTDLPTDEELVTIKKQFFTETPKQVVARAMPALTQRGLLGRNVGIRLN